MREQAENEKPEIYALRQDSGSWQISRRDFLKAAGIGAAAAGAGMSCLVHPVSGADDLESTCNGAAAHKDPIQMLLTSADGKYLLSYSSGVMKCWDFDTCILSGKKENTLRNSAAAFYKGKSCLLTYSTGNVYSYKVPFDSGTDRQRISDAINTGTPICVTGGRGDDYFVLTREGKILKFVFGKSGTIFELSDTIDAGETLQSGIVINADRRMFAHFEDGSCGVVDLTDGSVNKFDAEQILDYAVVPGELAVVVLVGAADESKEYRCYSLTDGKMLWKEESSMKFHRIAVTPDGTLAVMLMDSRITLRAVSDGKLVRSENYGMINFDKDSLLTVSGDGSKIAVSVGKSILFITLPDLKLVGCPVDLKEMKDNTKGIEVQGVDVVTGKTVNYTLPCGSSIPAGAVCTCNCVAGKGGCAVNCRCVGNTCSCNSHKTSYSYSYWYPN